MKRVVNTCDKTTALTLTQSIAFARHRKPNFKLPLKCLELQFTSNRTSVASVDPWSPSLSTSGGVLLFCLRLCPPPLLLINCANVMFISITTAPNWLPQSTAMLFALSITRLLLLLEEIGVRLSSLTLCCQQSKKPKMYCSYRTPARTYSYQQSPHIGPHINILILYYFPDHMSKFFLLDWLSGTGLFDPSFDILSMEFWNCSIAAPWVTTYHKHAPWNCFETHDVGTDLHPQAAPKDGLTCVRYHCRARLLHWSSKSIFGLVTSHSKGSLEPAVYIRYVWHHRHESWSAPHIIISSSWSSPRPSAIIIFYSSSREISIFFWCNGWYLCVSRPHHHRVVRRRGSANDVWNYLWVQKPKKTPTRVEWFQSWKQPENLRPFRAAWGCFAPKNPPVIPHDKKKKKEEDFIPTIHNTLLLIIQQLS